MKRASARGDPLRSDMTSEAKKTKHTSMTELRIMSSCLGGGPAASHCPKLRIWMLPQDKFMQNHLSIA